MSSESPSFREFELNVRERHGFERVTPKEEIQGKPDDQIRGMLQMLSRRIIELCWKDFWMSVEKDGGIVKAMYQTDPLLGDQVHCKTIETACPKMASAMFRRLSGSLAVWMHDMETGRSDIEAFSSFGNYSMALLMGGSKIGLSRPFEHLIAGFKTGITEAWRVIMESFRAYKHQYGEELDEETFLEIAGNSSHVLTKLASTHVRVLANYTLVVNDGNIMTLNACADPTLFRIDGETPHRRLELSSKLAEMVKDKHYLTERKEFSGCPALFAKGIKHPNVVEDLYHEMVIPAAKHHLQWQMRD